MFTGDTQRQHGTKLENQRNKFDSARRTNNLLDVGMRQLYFEASQQLIVCVHLIVSANFIHTVALQRMGNIPLYCRPYFVYLFIHEHWDSLYFLDIINYVLTNIVVEMQALTPSPQNKSRVCACQPYVLLLLSYISIPENISSKSCLNSFEYIPTSRFDMSYGHFLFLYFPEAYVLLFLFQFIIIFLQNLSSICLEWTLTCGESGSRLCITLLYLYVIFIIQQRYTCSLTTHVSIYLPVICHLSFMCPYI